MRDTAWKARILRAAAELFAEHGYHGTGIAQLEEAVGLRRGALYHHIGSKEAVLFEISTAPLRLMVEAAQAIEERVAGPEERFRELARTLLDNVAEHVLEWTVHYRDFTALTGERRREMLELRHRYERVWWRTLTAGMATGVFKPVPEPVVLKGIMGMFNYSYVWLRKDGPLPPGEIADAFCETFLSGIRA
ncbi:TetR/AcrR family transcriptional regulator [Amycolatopsis rhizosphaerae]|uniref:TetR/AcrR family transcriptional regulator n=1 Tax=Amycolatopsis rhizosphaerae TaxID=2053003 RepID=A0A558AE04_9PSEU|nr:TetR/AcrR family transcriptional regulator [Amycolatopsis rhizosphaerae]TVT22498.1 TetR/AcrR family transcriptional regulator [Amycolatopsis rhizosphaerae]